MKEFSTTQASNLTAVVGVIAMILSHFGVNIGSEELTLLLGAIISVVGIVSNWINRYKKGDLTVGGFRK